MRVLLHTPLKPPDSPHPSGDREMARGLVAPAAPARPPRGDAGAEPRRARRADAAGASRARTARARAGGAADRPLARAAGASSRALRSLVHLPLLLPQARLAGPDRDAARSASPMCIAEASHAPRRAQGPTRLGHRAVERALAAADLVLTVNPRDVAGVKARLRPGAHQRLAAALHRHRAVRAAAAARGQRSAAAAERRHDAHARQARLLSRAGRGLGAA